MSKYFTAIGTVRVRTLTETCHKDIECKFHHVVLADNATGSGGAEDKVIDYYIQKSDYYESYTVLDMEIFDFIQ